MLCQTYQLLLLKSGLSYLPCSNDGDAMGDSSMLKNMIPSFGRLSFGATSSHDTWAMTLQNASLHSNINVCRVIFAKSLIWNITKYKFAEFYKNVMINYKVN